MPGSHSPCPPVGTTRQRRSYRSLEQFNAQGLDFTQHVQTNATLINDAWCDCFRRNKIVVGISVDGPEDIHDAHRRFRNGRGSHAMAMKGIEALHRNDVPFHCISVVTADAPERIFFRDNGINDVGFNVEERSTPAPQCRAPQWRRSTATSAGHLAAQQQESRGAARIRAGDQPDPRQCADDPERAESPVLDPQRGLGGQFLQRPELLSVASDRYGSFLATSRICRWWSPPTPSSSVGDGRHEQRRGDLPQELRILRPLRRGNGSNKFWEHGTLASSETNACRFGTQIPTQVLLERFEEGPPLTLRPITSRICS